MNQELSPSETLNSTSLILTKINYQKDLANEMRDFIQIVCQDIIISNKLKDNSNTTIKLNMIMETIRCFVESFNKNINSDLEKKFSEYEELLYIQMKDKRVFKNEYEMSLAEIKKELEQRDNQNVFNEANEVDNIRDRNESKKILQKLEEFENDTKELIRKVSESKQLNEHQESELLKKIDNISRRISQVPDKPEMPEDNEIINQFREIVNLNETCKNIHLALSMEKKRSFESSLDRINTVIYDQLSPAFDQLKKDLTTLHERLKAKSN